MVWVVVDTDVLVSALTHNGKSRKLVLKLLNAHIVILSRQMLAELADVLARGKFSITSSQIDRFLSTFGVGFSIKRWSNRRRTNIPKEIKIRPQLDIGKQQIESASPIRLDFEIRLRPVLDHGKQDIEAKGPSIIDKRRQR